MDLLIKNMEKPKSCGECKLAVNAYGSLKEGKCAVLGYGVTYLRERHDACPLVEVPPHGRLIDADILRMKYEYGDGRKKVDESPTILEATNG